jgi:hypothetical protein
VVNNRSPATWERQNQQNWYHNTNKSSMHQPSGAPSLPGLGPQISIAGTRFAGSGRTIARHCPDPVGLACETWAMAVPKDTKPKGFPT